MAKCRYYKMCWLRLGYDCDEWNSDCRGGGDEGCKRFEFMPNVKSLLALADEMEQAGKDYRYQMVENACCDNLIDDGPDDFIGYATRIRKALGVEP